MASGLDREKASAARAAAEEVREGQLIALGTGTTAAFVVREIARRFPDGGGLVGVASSRGTEELARGLGLTVRPLAPGDRFELMIDGADEVSDALDLTKGGGGALFREKLLARRSKRLVIVVDSTKLVRRLGTRAPIPVEIVPFAKPVVVDALLERGLRPRLRTVPGPPSARSSRRTAWRSSMSGPPSRSRPPRSSTPTCGGCRAWSRPASSSGWPTASTSAAPTAASSGATDRSRGPARRKSVRRVYRGCPVPGAANRARECVDGREVRQNPRGEQRRHHRDREGEGQHLRHPHDARARRGDRGRCASTTAPA